MAKISIIVPIYNVEKYINRCVDSILNQTFTDFELILVDDGSPDNSGKICEEYAQNDNRIKVIHKENGGVSSARNCGLKNATGEKIIFIDADDYINNTYLSEITKYNADIVCCGHILEDESRNIIENETLTDTDYYFSMNNKKALEKYYIKGAFMYVTDKLFKSCIIKGNELFFNEGMKLGEDVAFSFQYIQYCKSFVISKVSAYHYVEYNLATRKTATNCSDEMAMDNTNHKYNNIEYELTVPLFGQKTKKIFTQRYVVGYKYLLNRALYGNYTYKEIKSIFQSYWFRQSFRLINIKHCYKEESFLLKLILLTKSPRVFLFYKRLIKNYRRFLKHEIRKIDGKLR